MTQFIIIHWLNMKYAPLENMPLRITLQTKLTAKPYPSIYGKFFSIKPILYLS